MVVGTMTQLWLWRERLNNYTGGRKILGEIRDNNKGTPMSIKA